MAANTDCRYIWTPLYGYTLVVDISGYCPGRINFVMPDYTAS
jgi:hypothetical protein